MSLRSKIARAWFAQRLRAIDRFRRHPLETQEAMFRRALERGRGTAFGERYGLAAIRTPEQFAAAVPAFDYESFKPWIERMMSGERDVTAPGCVE
ncbi:MAG: GH3 auxin-responsive promoter family protein, partial [Alistipes sp.]|nr:GH3 auxin-responsive promoter family protein [Alistipes sp.]